MTQSPSAHDDNRESPEPRRRYRLLVIDDHNAILESVGRYIDQTGVAELAGTCNDPTQAVEQCRRVKPDLVLCDAHMPVVSGIDVTREIRRTMPNLPVLMFSARDGEELRQNSIAAGASALVSKMASPNELRDAIETAVASISDNE